jgi:hypothetical protein
MRTPHSGGGNRFRYGTVGGQNDDRQRDMEVTDGLEQGQAIHPSHAQIRNNQMRLDERQLGQSLFGTLGRMDLIAGTGKAHGEQTQKIGVVIHQ